jgi:TolB-like protein/Tfp pilus assembly protein PilF
MKLGNFFAELKRRNVYKVAVAYAVVAWLVIQVSSTVLPTFHAPEWVVQTLVVLVALGFPIALVIAWAFEATPEGIKRTEVADAMPPAARQKKHVWIYIVVIGGGISVGLFFVGRYSAMRNAEPRPASAELRRGEQSEAAAVAPKSIAVLPFDNLSRDPDNAYFCEGVQDEILTRLAKVADLKVISRTSTQHFKSAPENLPQIAKQLGVMNILEGSVQKANDQVRVNVQLINAMTDAHLWADTYDRKLTDIFTVETEIAKTIADMLQAKLSGSEKMMMAKRATENSEAYELYLKGRHFWNRRTEADLRKALEFFQQAIAKDPEYAMAYAGAADCWSVMPNYSNDAPKQYIDRAIPLARRAIELDDSLAEAHAALANAIGTDLQLAACELEFKRAFALNPNYASAHQWYGEVLQSLGRFEEATAELRRAHDVDPLSLIINAILASTLYSGGNNEQALEQIRRTLDLDPDFNVAYWARGQINESMGNLDQAIADYTKATTTGSPSDPSQAMIACVYARSGRRAEADKILNELMNESQRRFVSSYALAQINAVLGNKDEAIRLLEKAYDERSIPIGGCGIGGPKIDNRFDALRNDPGFQKFVAKFIGGAK